ncbi:DNA repair and recombination protein rad54b [Desmophyllum pertusum]|uniref:DNA repair and recombination protein rad54b n=1 Tax=Desmophyllum pertusum TaxID=174260 RepID=A0A9W9Z0L6_9CNID|nr:DNA repair and recombination protein rad54b [Desmophyllum pertusum]
MTSNAPGALVMPRPSATHQLEHNRGGLDIRDVGSGPTRVPALEAPSERRCDVLYECVLGLRNFNGNGAILA